MSRPNDALEVIEMLDKSGPESYMNPLAQYDQLKDELCRVKALTYADLVPHGEWRFVCQIFCDGGYDDIYVCSECYEELDIGIGKGLPNYCPNCGARMDLGG